MAVLGFDTHSVDAQLRMTEDSCTRQTSGLIWG